MKECNCDELARKAANPETMGAHGQPNGRRTEAPQERDSNHPKGTNQRAGLGSPSRSQPGTPGNCC